MATVQFDKATRVYPGSTVPAVDAMALDIADGEFLVLVGPSGSGKSKALSGGQRQRVAMGRAIVRSPHVFLMDEPLSNLDAKLRVQTRTQIASLQRRLGVTTVYVTHDQIEALTMGDRIAVLKDLRPQLTWSKNSVPMDTSTATRRSTVRQRTSLPASTGCTMRSRVTPFTSRRSPATYTSSTRTRGCGSAGRSWSR